MFWFVCIVAVIAWWIQWPLINIDKQNEILSFCLRISGPIFIIGITLTTSIHNLSKTGHFTAEYLNSACRLPDFSVQSFLSVFTIIIAQILISSQLNNQVTFLVYLAIASTFVIIYFFLFIVVALIRCVNPKTAIELATRLSTTNLINEFAKKDYKELKEIIKNPETERTILRISLSNTERWNSNLVKNDEALKKAVESRDLAEINAWLKSTTETINRLFNTYNKIPSMLTMFQYDLQRLDQLMQVYKTALEHLFVLKNKSDRRFVEIGLSQIFRAVNDEINSLFKTKNYYCLRPLLWIVSELYIKLMNSAYKDTFKYQRAYFGTFYEYPKLLFEKLPTDCSKEIRNNFRQILHEGLTIWLLKAIIEKDHDLIKDLCEAGQNLVFNDPEIDLNSDITLLQHLVLVGKLITDIIEDKPNIISNSNLQNLFYNSIGDFHITFEKIHKLYQSYHSTIDDDLYRYNIELGVDSRQHFNNPLKGSFSYVHQKNCTARVRLIKGYLYTAALTMQINSQPKSIYTNLFHLKPQLNELKQNAHKLERPNSNTIKQSLESLEKCILDGSKI